MNELLKYLIRHFSFLYYDYGARFVDSQTNGGDAFIELEMQNMRLRFVRDRDQLFLFFRSTSSHSQEWFSLDLVRQFIRQKPSNRTLLDPRLVAFVRENLREILKAFSPANREATERILDQYARERAKKMFG